jgi:hypothetical protein
MLKDHHVYIHVIGRFMPLRDRRSLHKTRSGSANAQYLKLRSNSARGFVVSHGRRLRISPFIPLPLSSTISGEMPDHLAQRKRARAPAELHDDRERIVTEESVLSSAYPETVGLVTTSSISMH